MSDDLIACLRASLGDAAVISDPDILASHLRDWRGLFEGRARCLLRPGSGGETAIAVRLCREWGAPIVPQGGNTGLAGGATPSSAGDQIVLSLSRMQRVRDIDRLGLTMEVEAGCILKAAQDAARGTGCLLPISLAAEGSATIGGVISTNAGGVNVMRYGMTRALVLGLEVVLPDGTLLNGLRRLRKNNAGYDWKQLFIGAEGTLGIVTAAVLRLMPQPRHSVVALIEVADPTAAVELLALAQEFCGDQISAFELLSPQSITLLARELGMKPGVGDGGWLVLIDTASSLDGLRDAMMGLLEEALERQIVGDGTIAASETQAARFWSLREQVTEAESLAGPSAKHDVSVPIPLIPAFCEAAQDALRLAGYTEPANIFGHVGDGNIHYNVPLAPGVSGDPINRIVHDLVEQFGGSISAEHGIGQYRTKELKRYLGSEEWALTRRIKDAVDPEGLCNPGKIFTEETP